VLAALVKGREFDTIVTALPLLPNAELLKSLEGNAPEIYNIGDCKEPNLTVNAIADGARIARTIYTLVSCQGCATGKSWAFLL
jgi:hypothetical protein